MKNYDSTEIMIQIIKAAAIAIIGFIIIKALLQVVVAS